MIRTNSIIYACLALTIVLGVALYGASPQKVSARLGGVDLSLEQVSTAALKEKGLSGRDGLGMNEGMLFVFQHPDFYRFWMKDMDFPIDILWLDDSYRIVDVAQAVQPNSYPQTFVSRSRARFVLELPAGFFVKHRLKIGNTLEILK